MNRFATRRLIDACASLNAADRALLNLWVNRGLADGAVARMTNMTEAAVAQRRARIVDGLSQELGLPPPDIRGALGEIAESWDAGIERAGAAVLGNGAVSSPVPEASDSHATPEGPEPSREQPFLAPPPPAQSRGQPSPPPTRRRALPVAVGLLLVAVVAVVLVVALGSTPARRSRAAVAHPAPAVRQTAPAVSPTPSASPSPSSRVNRRTSHRFGALPGRLGHATGTLVLIGPRRNLKLRLTVRHLTAARDGHYEVWLYNSILDSEPLGRLRAGVSKMTLRLSANASRFRWIDISFQPIGFIDHSGESVLRAANPATARRLLEKRSVGRRRLHRTIGGSTRHRRSR